MHGNNRFLPGFLALVTLLATQLAQAWTYQNEDVILMFRKAGYNDVEFNLGGVSQFLGKPNGSATVVSNFTLSLVTDTFGANLGDEIQVALVAATSLAHTNRRAWVSSAEPNTIPRDRTPSQWLLHWMAVGGSVSGNGTNQILSHTTAGGVGFYSVVRSPE